MSTSAAVWSAASRRSSGKQVMLILRAVYFRDTTVKQGLEMER